MEAKKKRLILASASPRRSEILKLLGLEFSVIPAQSELPLPENMPVKEAVLAVAKAKAQSVFKTHPDAVVIGSDTVVAVDETVLGKPENTGDAKRMLKLLSGRTHTVYTAVYVCSGDLDCGFTESAQVDFAVLSQDEIDRYTATGEPLDKAGAYGIQGYGARFITGIRGDFYSIMGFPAARFYSEFKALFDIR